MGILHSTSRSLEDGGGERPIYPHLLRSGQNHGDSSRSSERLPKVSIFYNGVKAFLLLKLRFVFYLVRRRKAADPLLPVQNPETGLSSEPLLDNTTDIISSSTCVLSIPEEREETIISSSTCVLSLPEEREGNIISSSTCVLSIPEEREETIISSSTCVLSIPEEREETGSRNDVPFVVEEREKEEKNVEIKNVIAVSEERWIGHYSSGHRILLVGDGDFSFSASLAVAFGSAPNIIATSLDSHAFLKKNYCDALSNIKEIRSRGSIVMHEIDATKMANHPLLRQLRFDRIIFNFPYAGLHNLKNLPRDSQLRRHRRLVSQFLKNAREMLSENGEIHVSHKTNSFHVEFKLEHVASSHRLRLIEAVKFDCADYPRYNTKYGFGGDKNFDYNPSKTYKFGLKRAR